MQRLAVGIALAGALSFGLAGVASAQEAGTAPTVPAAAECTVAPISFERLSAIVATPVAETAAPDASPIPVTDLPDGEPADAETAAAVEETITHLVACINAGDALRGLELYSDRFVAQAFVGARITREMYDDEGQNLNPRKAGAEVVLYDFGDVVIVADGRAAVIVTGDDLASPKSASATLFYLVNEDGSWRVDETIEDIE